MDIPIERPPLMALSVIIDPGDGRLQVQWPPQMQVEHAIAALKAATRAVIDFQRQHASGLYVPEMAMPEGITKQTIEVGG